MAAGKKKSGASPRRLPVRRRLDFSYSGNSDPAPPADSDVWLDNELKRIEDCDRQRWNFDFASEKPGPFLRNQGTFQWEAVDQRTVPGLYRTRFMGEPSTSNVVKARSLKRNQVEHPLSPHHPKPVKKKKRGGIASPASAPQSGPLISPPALKGTMAGEKAHGHLERETISR